MQLFNYFAKLTPFNLEAFRFYHVFAVVCIIYISSVLIKCSFKRNRWMRALEQFPGPPGHWLLGHATQFKQDGTDLEKIPKWGEQYPFAFPLHFGPDIIYLFVHHPSYVKPILATTGPKDISYRFLISWIGEGLLVSAGQKWFCHRRLLTPGFHYDILKPYMNLLADSANIMLDKWEVYAKTGQTFELFQHVSLMTLDSIMKCAFSCQSNCQTESRTNPYIKAVYELCNLVNLRFRVFPYRNDIIFHLSPHGYRYRRACKIAHTHTDEVIRQRREILNNNKKNQDDAQEKRYLDFLDILLCARDEQQQGLSDEAIRAEVDTFMFEGHDTTASGISWIFYSMACNPEHQQKCREEIQQVLMGKDTIEWEDLSKIPYTTMCIKESLRMYPPVPGMGRRLSQPITFFDGRTVPAGQLIGISIYGIHHNPTVWENPKVFDPLRFLPENTAKRSPHAFVPFSAGPRNCIGQNFAMNEMKVAVALTLRKYVLIKDPDHTPKMIPRLVLRSLNGIHLKIKLVEN
ncbi:cytochrome P450 4A6-like isoform X1 [Hemibagrus wyckioides]|uniref:cytochrome P450 4A6-like isoform X1 n=1 Tax=Hemibagrus wyckioides TaxID=337641 RepID=UPI00266D15EF|nr:cytochrome P450 4A6-like isoform X1 [Hemibagrus wyckioides]